MRFKLDENLHPELAGLLNEHGHDAITVWDQSLRGCSDPTIASVCRDEDRVLVTLDLDFADIRRYPPKEYPGLIVMRLTHQSRSHVRGVFQRLLPLIHRERLVRRLWIVEESRVRIRGDVNQASGR